MTRIHEENGPSFDWTPHPAAAALIAELVEEFLQHSAAARKLAARMRDGTGTRLVDWIDHLALPDDDALRRRLSEVGFVESQFGEETAWEHRDGMFPRVRLHGDTVRRLAIKVESVGYFMMRWQGGSEPKITPPPAGLASVESVQFDEETGHELWAVERHGDRRFGTHRLPAAKQSAISTHMTALWSRRRDFASDEEGFAHAGRLLEAAIGDLGVNTTCDLFFAGERMFWQQRNRAAHVQAERQEQLGLSWANHDHHTYRCSRRQFTRLVATLEQIGFECRERFYAGKQAGWGAQVLEQPQCGITVFADVDLADDEVTEDFAHCPLADRDELGTVGLWCRLHGEAFLQAGLHHLECQFDYARAREQLETLGVSVMDPFTDFPHLKQAFTAGEMWPVETERIQVLLSEGQITEAQAATFRCDGAIGSHLEILERNNGYKGFNQTGISEIISRIDPRKMTDA
jgi:hypothetical protein